MSKPLVSITCLTYNHEKFLKQTLNGFLMQKTKFKFEVIIHDDASTDNTSKIIDEYQKKHPEIFKCICQTENQWSKGKKPFLDFLWPEAQGKYIAICEGDDYWIDPCKLQKQVDFLESHSDYVICGTGVKRVDAKTGNEVPSSFKKTGTLQLIDILYRNQITTCTSLFRNLDINQTILPNHHKFTIGDWPLWCGLLQFGKAYNMPDVTAQYNIHNGGMVSGRNLTKTLYSKLYDRLLLLENFPQYKKIIKKHGNRIILHYIKQCMKLKPAYAKALWNNKGLILKYLTN
jgi:glycosyltransferase involved in cell wall biosynthesis